MTTLADVIQPSLGKANTQKLSKLTQLIESYFGVILTKIVADDPFVIRKRIVSELRREGSTAGVIQAYEQFFMGIVRRAAVEGVIPAPPEGPWTRNWQTVLDFAHTTKRPKSVVRMLAAWASDKDFEPDQLSQSHLLEWQRTADVSADTLDVITDLLTEITQCGLPDPRSDGLTIRLRQKATHGSVKGNISAE